MTDSIVITNERYKKLVDAEYFLECLEACGVDNWDGYSDAIHMSEEEED